MVLVHTFDPELFNKFGEFMEISLNDSAKKHYFGTSSENTEWFALTRLGWQNLVNTPYFNTFIARLYNGSFESDKIKQDFRLRRIPDSIIHSIYRLYGGASISEALGGEESRLDTFNSTSISSNLLLMLINSWRGGGNLDKDLRLIAYRSLL